jgi:hypothetical protein
MRATATRNYRPQVDDRLRTATGTDGAGHAVVLCFVRILHNGEAPALFDFAEPEGTVAPRAGDDHADRLAIVTAGERAEEMVDRGPLLAALFEISQTEVGACRSNRD